jgi:mono/diheme cytochrome c family protein
MSRKIRNIVFFSMTVVGLILGGCGSAQIDLSTVTPAQIQAYASALTPAQLQAYTAALTPAQIQTIAGSLTLAQLQAIAPFLAMVSGGTAGTTVTPEALYASTCSGCHGPLATSSKKGVTLARLQSAISGNIGGMGSLTNSLTLSQMQTIVTALAATTTGTGTTVPPVANGSTLYASDCAGCHGALASSAKLGATTARIQSAISGNTGGMGSLSNLSVTDIQAISNALATTGTGAGTTPQTDGAALFNSYCSSCHSSMGSTSLSSIQSAIRSQSRMNSLSSLTSAQLQSIVTYLSTAGGGSRGGGD